MKEDEGGWWTASELPVARCDQLGPVPLPCFPLFLAVRFHGQRDGFFFYAARQLLSFFYRSEDGSQTDEGALCPARYTAFNRRGIRRLSRRPFNLRLILVVGADDLSKRGIFYFPDPLAIVIMDGKQLHKTRTVKKSLSPRWNESFYM